jgi:hypothetical protein
MTETYGSEAVVLGGTLAVVVVFPGAIVVDDGVPV